MQLQAIHRRVVGLDVHQSQITACALIEQPDDTTRIERRQFGAFKRDRRALAEWVSDLNPDVVVSDIHGESARAMVKSLIAGESSAQAFSHLGLAVRFACPIAYS